MSESRTGNKSAAESSNIAKSSSPVDAASESSIVDFQSSIRAEGKQRLVISYQVTNRSDKPVLVLNRLAAQLDSTNIAPDPNAVYIEPTEDGTIEISKRAYPTPNGPTVTTPYLPGASMLEPGQSISEEIRVALPLRRRRPYMSVVPAPAMPDPARKIKFCLGVAPAEGIVTRAFGEGSKRALYPQYSVVLKQKLFCSDTVTID